MTFVGNTIIMCGDDHIIADQGVLHIIDMDKARRNVCIGAAYLNIRRIQQQRTAAGVHIRLENQMLAAGHLHEATRTALTALRGDRRTGLRAFVRPHDHRAPSGPRCQTIGRDRTFGIDRYCTGIGKGCLIAALQCAAKPDTPSGCQARGINRRARDIDPCTCHIDGTARARRSPGRHTPGQGEFTRRNNPQGSTSKTRYIQNGRRPKLRALTGCNTNRPTRPGRPSRQNTSLQRHKSGIDCN